MLLSSGLNSLTRDTWMIFTSLKEQCDIFSEKMNNRISKYKKEGNKNVYVYVCVFNVLSWSLKKPFYPCNLACYRFCLCLRCLFNFSFIKFNLLLMKLRQVFKISTRFFCVCVTERGCGAGAAQTDKSKVYVHKNLKANHKHGPKSSC